MRKEILKLFYEETVIQTKLKNLTGERASHIDRIFLVRKLMEVRRQINLYTPEEIFTAQNYYNLKKKLYIKKLKQLALQRAREEDEEQQEKKIDTGFLEAFFLFLLLHQTNNLFISIGEIVITLGTNKTVIDSTNKLLSKKS